MHQLMNGKNVGIRTKSDVKTNGARIGYKELLTITKRHLSVANRIMQSGDV